MFSRILQIILVLTTLFFTFGIFYFLFFVNPEHLILTIGGKQLDFRLIGLGFCLVMIVQNSILFAILRIDFLGRYSLKLKLDSHAILATDQSIPVTVQIQENIEVPIDEILDIDVPINQDAEILIRDVINVPLDVVVKIPIDDEVDVEATVPIKTTLHLNTKVETSVLGAIVKIPIQLAVPLALEVPIQCKARVKKENFSVHIQHSLPILVKDPVPVHLDTTLHTRIPFRKTLRIPLKMAAHTQVQMDQAKPIKIKGEFILHRDSVKMTLVQDRKVLKDESSGNTNDRKKES